MDLNLKEKTFIICGATSGFGNAIAKQLIEEGSKIVAIARGEEKLKEFKDAFPGQVESITGDITLEKTQSQLFKTIGDDFLAGILVNSAGPPAKTFAETTMEDWDEAYAKILRWKVKLTQLFLPKFIKQQYGRFLYIESSAVKQPLENLVLSTSLRLSVVGFVKTLSQEIPDQGVTFNILAPGYNYTPAVERLIKKRAENDNISKKEARAQIEANIPLKRTGNIEYLASLAAWLLSAHSEYMTGQIITIDGGVVRSTL